MTAIVDNIAINIAEDRMSATITIQASATDFPAYETISGMVRQAGVTKGIDSSLLQDLVAKKENVRDLVFARGRPAEKGNNARINWHIEQPDVLRPLAPNGGRIDFKKTRLFESVKENQILAVKIPAAKGRDGYTVDGRVLDSTGRDISLPAGRNTRILEDGLTLVADKDGSVIFDNEKVNVENVYHIRGDVSYTTGNIKFNGPVVIEGDVRSGFRVEARDAVFIGGNVEAASVYSQKGDITIQCGVVGKNRAKILAGNNLICGFIQDATVGVRGDVIICHYIINSEVSAGRRVILNKNEGLIRGGCITADYGILVRNVGSAKNVHTELKIHNQSEKQSHNQLWEISRSRTELNMRISGLEKKLSFLEVLGERIRRLSEQKINEKNRIREEVQRLKIKKKDLEKYELQLQRKTSKDTILKEVVIEEALHPNVSIEINGIGFYTDEQMSAVKVSRFKNEILVESLSGMDDRTYDIFVPGQKM